MLREIIGLVWTCLTMANCVRELPKLEDQMILKTDFHKLVGSGDPRTSNAVVD